MTAADDVPVRFVGDIQRLEMKPGDVLVLSTPKVPSREFVERLIKRLANRWPGVELLVLADGMTATVIGGARVYADGGTIGLTSHMRETAAALKDMPGASMLLTEAAAEIERLRKALTLAQMSPPKAAEQPAR
jgi:hypothetical protein